MAIILAGDIHGMLNFDKISDYFEEYNDYTKDDFLILLGDTGILWDDENDYEVRRNLEELPVTTLWIDGNHDNFDLLEDFPEEIWHGGHVHVISESILHLERGQIFEIDGLKFFTFGGGNSIDKAQRQEGINWWSAEMPFDYEYEEGLNNLEKTDWKEDYILTHTCPESVVGQLTSYLCSGEETFQRYLEQVAEKTEFEAWYFGHWHEDESIDNFQCLYNEMVTLIP